MFVLHSLLDLIVYFFDINHEVSWGGPQLWEAPLSPYHNPDYKSPLEPGGTGSPNKGDFPTTRTGEQTQSNHLRGLHCQWNQHFVGFDDPFCFLFFNFKNRIFHISHNKRTVPLKRLN